MPVRRSAVVERGRSVAETQQLADVVAEEWCAALGVTRAQSEDEFFVLGGNSMRALAFVTRVEERLGIVFPLEVLFIEGKFGAVLAACREAGQ